MKNVLFAGLLVLLLVFTVFAGNITINPGSERTLTQDPATGGSSGTNGNPTYALLSSFDVNTKTLKANSLSLPTGIGTGTATAQIFYEFEVGSTPATAGNTVGAWVSYVADWAGRQTVLAIGTSNSSVEIELVLRDITGSSNLHIEPVHLLDLQTHRAKFVLVGGVDFNDSGLKVTTFPAVLKRGHTYRLTFRLSATAFLLTVPTSGALAECNYSAPGVRLHSMYVKLGLDEKEVLERLESFENHRHIYLTGKGVGHNNIEATSSPPIVDKPSLKMFPQTLLEEDTQIIQPEAVPTGKPIFEKP